MRNANSIPVRRSARSCRYLILLLLAIATGVMGCGGDDPVIVEDPDPVLITQVSAQTVAPGDTVTISGENFGATPAANLVVFNNRLGSAAPLTASVNRLDVVVPQNAASGPMWVETGGVRSNGVELTVTRGIGAVWTVGGSGDSYSFTIPVQSGTERYLIVPCSASQQSASFSYQVAPANATQSSRLERYASSSSAPQGGVLCMYDLLRRWIGSMQLERTGLKPRFASAAVTRTHAQADTMTFYVLNTLTPSTLPSGLPDPNDFSPVVAARIETGRRCYIYADINSPAGGLDPADYAGFRELFDGSIFPTDSTYFGPPTDIDENERVIILFTPVVNDLTPDGTAQTNGFYAGFFGPNDLLPSLFPAGTTNGAEIFYSLVPDPTGLYGNVFSKQQILDVVPPTLAHEFEHMISTGFRLVNYGVSYIQTTWLEEGMAHMAEDVNGDNSSNILRIQRYLPDPGGVPLMGDDTLEQRAAIYLLLRYAADQYGIQILRTMVQSSTVGTATLELVTGEQFFTTFADWLATLYLSGRGITTDSRYQYSSIDLLDTSNFPQPLLVTHRTVGQGAIQDVVAASAGDFFVMRNPVPPAVEFTVTADVAARLRLVVTRIQ